MKNIIYAIILLVTCQYSLAQSSDEDRRREEERRYRAINAEARVTVHAVGMGSYDCMQQAEYRAYQAEAGVINECNRQAEGLMTCSIVARHIVQYPSPIVAMAAVGKYDERDSDELTCRNKSIARSESQAVALCQATYGVSCLVTQRGVVTEYRTYKQRRYVIVGPKDRHHACTASAAAAPDSRYNTQCALEIVAKTRR